MLRIFSLFTLIVCGTVHAADLNWTGNYRLEYNYLNSGDDHTGYFNHHLILRPQMIAADGVTVKAKFDILNNGNLSSQLGQYFGNNTTASADTNSAATGALPSETLAVNELYLTWTNGYGSFIGGRAPVQFGLGITHNAGAGEFDHWFDVKDLVGYKVVFGNFYLLPMIGKVREDLPNLNDDINDLMIQFMYENLESDLSLGIFYQSRTSTTSGNDLLVVPASPFGGNTRFSDFNMSDFNIYIGKKWGDLSLALETGYQSGDTGVSNGPGGPEVSVEGFAVAADLNYKKKDSAFAWNLKAGSVSGNDPNSANKYEGYLMDRNYDLGVLLFNHSFVADDILGSNSFKGLETNPNVDVEYLTNAIYASPGIQWKWNDKWGLNGRIVYAMLSREQFANGGTNLGLEFDAGVFYRPHERMIFKVDAGILLPGDAFEAGTLNRDTNTAYGIITKAAVSF